MTGQGVAARGRMYADAFVYISASRNLQLIKIGWTKSSNREKSMNKDGYGGATDWLLLYERRFKNSGTVEQNAHGFLGKFRVRQDYVRLSHGYTVQAKELFCCNYADAYEAIEQTLQERTGSKYERHDVRDGFQYRI
jgi:hypothetical protein